MSRDAEQVPGQVASGPDALERPSARVASGQGADQSCVLEAGQGAKPRHKFVLVASEPFLVLAVALREEQPHRQPVLTLKPDMPGAQLKHLQEECCRCCQQDEAGRYLARNDRLKPPRTSGRDSTVGLQGLMHSRVRCPQRGDDTI